MDELTDGERRILSSVTLDNDQRARLQSYLARRALSRRRIHDVSEGSMRAWLRKQLGLDVKKVDVRRSTDVRRGVVVSPE